MSTNPLSHSPDCDCCSNITRRSFLKTTVAGAALAATGSLPALAAAEKKAAAKYNSETLVTSLYKSMTEEQKKAVCFSFDDPLRSKVDNNWHITKQKIAEFFNKDQQAMIHDIFVGLHNPEYVDRVLGQVEHDNGNGGFGTCAIAIFGQPGSGKFEFVFTGRHVTRRCDGDSVYGAAFGGPIFYGHAAESFNEKPTHPGNVYWYQARRANEVFQMLDGKQRELALLVDLSKAKATETVKLSGKKTGLP